MGTIVRISRTETQNSRKKYVKYRVISATGSVDNEYGESQTNLWKKFNPGQVMIYAEVDITEIGLIFRRYVKDVSF